VADPPARQGVDLIAPQELNDGAGGCPTDFDRFIVDDSHQGACRAGNWRIFKPRAAARGEFRVQSALAQGKLVVRHTCQGFTPPLLCTMTRLMLIDHA
jgi:hypothetical protein